MSYRIVKKTTKKTEYFCLKCKYCEQLTEKDYWGCKVRCKAPNSAFINDFNAKDNYCIEYKGFNEMSKNELDGIIKHEAKKRALKEYKKYANTYYTKADAKVAIKEFKESLKR